MRPVALVVAAALTVLPSIADAQDLVVDLSNQVIEITTGFAGAEVLLFGTFEQQGEVVVVIRGPLRREIVRKKERVAGIWINRDHRQFEAVPTYYRVASTLPLSEIASQRTLALYQIGTENLFLPLAGGESGPVADEFRKALIRNKVRANLYGAEPSQVRIVGGRLFRTTVQFPANVPTGIYTIEVFLFDDGHLLNAMTRALTVRKVGLEAGIYNVAHRLPEVYGAIAIIVALVAGWLAGVVFRQR